MAWREHLTSASLALGGAVVWSLCFGREPSVWLPWLALVPLALLLGRRKAVLWGVVYAVTLWLCSMYWVAGTLESYGGLPRSLALLAQVLMAFYLGFDQMVFVALGRRIWKRGGLAPLWALPSLWVAIEWARGVAFGRFPWNLAAYAWVDVAGALPLAAWIGPWGVSFLLVFANVSLALAWHRRRWEIAVTGVLATWMLLVLAGRFSHGAEQGAGRGGEVRVIQPDTSIVSSWEESWDNYERLMKMSRTECAGAAESEGRTLLIWPESAAWPHNYATSERLRLDVSRLARSGCDVFLGSQTGEGEKVYNSVFLVSNGNKGSHYSKRKLVPWGEYVPLKDVLPFMGKVARAAGDFTAGTDLGLQRWGGEEWAPAICYEVIFAGAVAEQVQAGATVLVTVTNDAWYGDTWAPYQHFRAARFRAAENRRPLVRAALTGISGLIDRRGDVIGRLGVGERGVLSARISGSSELTPYTRAPWLVPLLCAVLAVVGVVGSWRRSSSARP